MRQKGSDTQQQQQQGQQDEAAIYEEMLLDCRRKAGEATLDRLRKLCQKRARPTAGIGNGIGTADGGTASMNATTEQGEAGIDEDETVIVSYHAALLGRAEGAANIYGG